MDFTELKNELLWHFKKAWTKKIVLMPFLAPCYLAWFLWNYIGCYLDDFIETVKFKTIDERLEQIANKKQEINDLKEKQLFATYAFISTGVYWLVFGFGHGAGTWQFLNLPTFYLFALPYEAIHQLYLLKVHTPI